MPTTHPRYTVTDTGELSRMLDHAQRRWPEIKDRRRLLLRLAEEGYETLVTEVESEEQAKRRVLQIAALARASDLVDVEALITDSAWR